MVSGISHTPGAHFEVSVAELTRCIVRSMIRVVMEFVLADNFLLSVGLLRKVVSGRAATLAHKHIASEAGDAG